MEIVTVAFFTLCCLVTGLVFILGRKRVAKNMRGAGRLYPNATPRSVAVMGAFMLAAVPVVWVIVLAGVGIR